MAATSPPAARAMLSEIELASEIRRRLKDTQPLVALSVSSAAASAHGLQPAEPPRPALRKRADRHIDYGFLQEENRKLGALGEQLVVAFEEQRLRQSGRTDLASRVRWVARDDGDGLGYDVLSFDASGNERHIEVKTTALGALTPFYISSAELEFARAHPSSFALYRVYDATCHPNAM